MILILQSWCSACFKKSLSTGFGLPGGHTSDGDIQYTQLTFEQAQARISTYAQALMRAGIQRVTVCVHLLRSPLTSCQLSLRSIA